MVINRNTLARHVSSIEGGHRNLSIAEIKEVLRVALGLLAHDYQRSAVLAMLEKIENESEGSI